MPDLEEAEEYLRWRDEMRGIRRKYGILERMITPLWTAWPRAVQYAIPQSSFKPIHPYRRTEPVAVLKKKVQSPVFNA